MGAMKINKFKEIYKKNEFNSYKGKRDRKDDWREKKNETDKRNKNRQWRNIDLEKEKDKNTLVRKKG